MLAGEGSLGQVALRRRSATETTERSLSVTQVLSY